MKRLGPAWSGGARPPDGHFTRKTATQALQAILTDARRGQLPGAATTTATFADAAAEWLRYVEHDRKRRPSTVEDYRNVVHVVVAFTGLRMGELLALRWGDVAFSKRLVHVRRSYTRGALGPTKSGRVRSVPMIDDVLRVLDGLSRRQFFTATDDLVFVNTVGNPMGATRSSASASTESSTAPGSSACASTTCATPSGRWPCRSSRSRT